MKDRHEHRGPFDPVAFEVFVRTWKTVKLKKELNLKTIPPSFRDFIILLDDEIFEVLDVKKGNSVTLCLCGKVPHTEDCLTWPHLSVVIEDLEGNIRPIHSLWLEPVEFLPDEKNSVGSVVIQNPAETEKSGIAEEVVAQEIISENVLGGDAHLAEDIVEGIPEQVMENMAQAFLENFSKVDRMEFMVVYLNKEGTLLVRPIDEFPCDDFISDYKTGQWLFGDLEGAFGELVFLEKDCPSKGFIMVIESKNAQLQKMATNLYYCSRAIFSEQIIQSIRAKV
ncbi:MAG: hypothetical protein US57_C0026G0004 [Candidatus Moranbacteria bacterium GW2011_GWC2_37_73]|nr:MAG: hypothetical protein UR95_C0004G0031 [Parcubacteria group bacterium GW2011_GWC1_36_108]KKQ30159.1 MAG: hypothetical protein US47_C0004G0001 [Candidatus Moranbacteria bacterium GW2011_GWE1_37_24]KKQ38968.1 MAG: hypothetical protein US57_C0026G0004 [Candidatus Moranbacteria bacterium GW2011_GWC2_37_73]HBU11108.1 hypothetical protein [Candidatus Moranbacteria bacterium]